jgi:hypothetical protein
MPQVLAAGLPAVTSVVQERQRKRLQVEPCEPFGVIGIKPMPFDAVLAELVTASVPFAFAEPGQRSPPITIRASAANVSLGTCEGRGNGHRSTSDSLRTRRWAPLCGISKSVRKCGQSGRAAGSCPKRAKIPAVTRAARDYGRRASASASIHRIG